VDVALLFVPLAGEPRRVVEVEAPVVIGTCTILAGCREYLRSFVSVGCSQVEISYNIDIEWVEGTTEIGLADVGTGRTAS
jgi:hypothetical protein